MLDLPLLADWQHPALDGCARAGLLTRDATPVQIATAAAGRIVYLATPYLDDIENETSAMGYELDASIACGEAAAVYAHDLALAGVSAFPAATLMAAILQADMGDFRLNPLDREFWSGWAAPFLRSAGAVAIAPLPGWDRSAEVWAVLRWAVGQNTPVFVMGEV